MGILGGIGSGKTTVAQMFAEQGAKVLNADKLAHDVLDSPEVRDEVVAWLGDGVLRPNGNLDRRAVARQVFQDVESVKRLEGLVHPPVLQTVEEAVKLHVGRGEREALVLDVPLLLGSPLQSFCQFLVYVDVPLELRRERAASRGWKPGEMERRERFQPGTVDKRQVSDFVIVNAGSLDATRKQVVKCYAKMKDLAGKGDGKPIDPVGSSEGQ